MSKTIIALLSFILGGGIGIIIASCLFMEKESDIKNEKNIRKTKND